MDIEQEISDLHAAAYAIYKAAALGAEPRDFTPEEQTRFQDLMKRKEALEARRAEQGQRRERLAGFERQLGNPLLPVNGNGQPPAGPQSRGGSLGERFTASPQYADFQRQFPSGVPDGARVHVPPVFLPAGTLSGMVGRKESPPPGDGADFIGLGNWPWPPQWFMWPELLRPWVLPETIVNLVTHVPCSSDAVAYPQLKSWTHVAAVVPEGMPKPRADMEWTLKTAPVETIAEWIAVSKQALADRAMLRALIDAFLRYGVRAMLETTITADLFNQVPTMGAASAAENLFDTARIAILQLETRGVMPNAFVFSPSDMAALDMAKDQMGRYYGAGPFGMGPNTLWGIRRVTSYFMDPQNQNKALVGDFRWDVWFDREADTISASDSHADFFIRNLVAILAEIRGLNAVLYPDAFLQFETPGLTLPEVTPAPTTTPAPTPAPAGGQQRPSTQPAPITTGTTPAPPSAPRGSRRS